MPFVGCLATADRLDGGPPLLALSRTPLDVAPHDSLQPSLRIGELEAANEGDWLEELCAELIALAEHHGGLEGGRGVLAEDWEPAMARVHYDEARSRFVVQADLATINRSGAFGGIVAAFELPRDERSVAVEVEACDVRRLLDGAGAARREPA